MASAGRPAAPAAPGASPFVAVAYSGGRDSTALLHATLHAAEGTGIEVHALHVHHGLSPAADQWLAHCQAQCERWARRGWPVHFHAEHLHLKPPRGASVEALARTARYAALRRMALAQHASIVLLAHHRRDQAETFLLQALRGAGAAGLAAMPASVDREGLTWARPWLARPRGAIEAYVRRYRLAHIEDDSNADPRFARNRLRLQVWPALEAAFAQAEGSLADAAARVQQLGACAEDLAAIDLATCAGPEGLHLAAWRSLAPHRAINALRAWLRRQRASAATAADTERLMRDLQRDGPARWPLAGGELRRYRGRLRWHAVGAVPGDPREALTPSAEAPQAAPSPSACTLAIRRAGRYVVPGWGGVLIAQRVPSGGIALHRLAHIELAPRAGGEQFQRASNRPARTLKKQYQDAAVPAWARSGPLCFDAGQLLFVPGLGIDARAIAVPGEPQLSLQWEPTGPV